MKYTAQSGKYILKNFLYIFSLAILPALFLTFSTDSESIQCVFETLFEGNVKEMHFEHLFRAISVLNFASWQSIVFGLLGIICTVFCVAMMLALLDKHMRIGKRTFNGIFAKVNDNIISTAIFTVILIALYEVWCLILSALLFFITRITAVVVAYVLGGLVYVGMHVVLIYILTTIYLWLPCMQITGFKPIEALHYSYQLVDPIKWKILIGQIIFLFATEALISVCATFMPSSAVFVVLTAVLYAVLLMVYCVRMEIAYFDRDGIERKDVRYY